jgi:acylphosphatase
MSGGERVVRVTISGVVQGVGFRAWTQYEAEKRGLKGFVRNRLNGDVEAVFAGPADSVEAMCEACKRGPRLAHVTGVEVEEADARALTEAGGGKGFRLLGTI